MTSFTPSRGDVALNKSGLGPVLYSFATQRDLMFGHSDVPLFVSAQSVVMGFFPVSFQHWLKGTFSHTACYYTYCISSSRAFPTRRDQPSSFGIVPVLSLTNRIKPLHNLSTFTPPAALLQYWGVKSKGLTCVPLAMCIVKDAWSASPTCCRRPSQIQSPDSHDVGAFHLSGKMWAVREEAHSFAVTPVSCVTKRVEDIMPALRAYHAREREVMHCHCGHARTKLLL